MKLNKLLNGIDCIKIEGNPNVDIKDMHYDSRKVTGGSLFFCIKGLTVDGHDYAAQAIDRGAKVLVLERDIDADEDITKVFVKDSRAAMAYMSGNFYNNPTRGITCIGITGTNGKTTVTHLVKSILEKVGQRVGLIGTITNMVGDRKIPSKHTTPESLDLQGILRDMADEDVDSIVMEVSSHSLSLGRVEGIPYDIGVFTNLSQDHLDFHGNMEEYRDTKARLFAQSKAAVINVDDEIGRWMLDRITTGVYTYGICKEADIYARELEITERGVTFNLHTPGGDIGGVNLGIPGIFSIYNALAAASVCYSLGIPLDIIVQGLEAVKGVDGRFELLDTGTDYSVILDYAHTPDGLENILQTADGFAKGRVITLFGCGGDRDHGKRPIMGEVAGRYSDYCIITSDNPRSEDPMDIIMDIEPGVRKTSCPYTIIENRREAIEYALVHAREGDVVILTGKGHETYQILKDGTIPFDEREIVSEILDKSRTGAK
ncbi:MAG TPA: UDP-N-acetylmuramoyl-L-alanyl-D-glutamate--2,6-diaminopimelate ligase [Clostridia bacterium]|nr:UDP-N-acetylmuramoyl-L-alanyl-D-glutamate--2,6-diaminopimelate ligase [Clostridia bacterium]